MKMVKVLRACIYKNSLFAGCSNKGISESYDEVYYPSDEGNEEVPEDTPNLIKFEKGARGSIHAVPYKDVAPNMVGWTDGGAYVSDCDSRFRKAVEKATGTSFYGAIALHDRCETLDNYLMP